MNLLDFTGLTEAEKYAKAGEFAGVPAELFAGMRATESAGNDLAVSRKGARGAFQIMPNIQSTWEERTGRSFDWQNFDDSLTMAALTLRENKAHFKNDDDALRAYNGGWDPRSWNNAETSAYVGKVRANAGLPQSQTVSTPLGSTAFNPWAGVGGPTQAEMDHAWYGGPEPIDGVGSGSGSAREPKIHLSDTERARIAQQGVAMLSLGADASAVAQQAVAAASSVAAARAVVSTVESATKPTLRAEGGNEGALSEAARLQAAAIEREEFAQGVTFLDKWGANSYSTGTQAIARWVDKLELDEGAYTPGYDYASRAREIEKGLTLNEVEQMREARSEADEERIRDNIMQQRHDARINGTLGTWSAVGYGVLGGLTDPAGMVAGLGVGKALHIAKVGASTYAAAGRTYAAIGASAAEGAAGNVALGAAMDLMGDYRLPGDYAMDLGAGLFFGGALGTPSVMLEVRAQARELEARGAVSSNEFMQRVMAQAGPDATPEQLRVVAQRLDREEHDAWMVARYGDVPENMRLGDRTEVGAEPTVTPVPAQPREAIVLEDGMELRIGDGEFAPYVRPKAPEAPEPPTAPEPPQDTAPPKAPEDLGPEDNLDQVAVPEPDAPVPPMTPEIRYTLDPPRDENGLAVVRSAYTPPAEHAVMRGTGNYKYVADARLVKGWNATLRSGSFSDLLGTIADIAEMPEDFRVLAAKLRETVDTDGLKPDRNTLAVQSGYTSPRFGGLYFRSHHALSIRRIDPEVILHEVIHARTVRQMQDNPNAPAVKELEELLEHIRKEVSTAKRDSWTTYMESRSTRTPDGRKGSNPLDSVDELIAYGLTNPSTQALLRELPSIGGKGRTAWESFLDAVARVLGFSPRERSALNDLLESTTRLLEDVDAGKLPLDPNRKVHDIRPRAVTAEAGQRAQLRRGDEVLDGEVRDGVFQPDDAPASERITPANVESVFGTEAEAQRYIDQHGIADHNTDPAMQRMIAMSMKRAELVMEQLKLDPARLKTMLSKVNLEATSTTMLSSQSEVMRAVGALLAENPEGAAGRHNTASLSRTMTFELYMGNLTRNTDQQFQQWRTKRGVGGYSAVMDDAHRTAFNKEVQLELNARWNELPSRSSDPNVLKAADLYDAGYKIMARDQSYVGVVGADAIDLKSSGYFQRRWNLGKLRNMSVPERAAFLNALEDQFRTVAGFTNGEDFSVRALAVDYLARLERRATGSIVTPTNLHSEDAGKIIEESLRALGVKGTDVARMMRKYQRGAASHTKNRIDMDYSKFYDDGTGRQFQLVDFLDNDMDGLYRRYAQRAAGEVTLAKYGVMGDMGIKVLRESAEIQGASQKELDAFDQFMAEMMGRPFGKGDPRLVQNARLLTGMTRLGGAVFPQLGAFVDAAATLGVGRAFRVAGDLNRMRKEVQAIARGEKVENSILGGFEGIGADFGMTDYQIYGLFDTMDQADIAGKESVGTASKLIRAGANINRAASGHRWMVAAQERGVAEQITRKALRYIREGKEDLALSDMGVNEDLAGVLRARLDDIATFDGRGELMSLDPLKLTAEDVEGRKAIIALYSTVARGTRQVMNREMPGEVGKWAHNGWLKSLFQFRTFSLVAQQKSLGRTYHLHGGGMQGATKVAGLMIGGMAVAIPIHMTRVALKASLMEESDRDEYIEKNTSLAALARASLNYLAVVGLWPDFMEAASSAGVGWADALGMELPEGLQPTGGRTMGSSEFIGGVAAPAVGVVNDLIKGAFGDTQRLSRTAPFGTLPYVQPLIMGMDSQLTE